MIMDKMLDGKKKRRLNKAWGIFFDFCIRMENPSFSKDFDLWSKAAQVQFDNIVMQIKEAYNVCD